MSGDQAESDGARDQAGDDQGPDADVGQVEDEDRASTSDTAGDDDPTTDTAVTVVTETGAGERDADETGADDTDADAEPSADDADAGAEPSADDTSQPAAPTSASRSGDRPDLTGRRQRSRELDWDDRPSSRRRRRWLVGAIVAVVVIALAIGASLYLLNRPSPQVTPPPVETPGASASTAAVLTANSMLSPKQAALILPKTTWTVASDQSGQATSTSAACLSPAAVQGAPNPQAIRSRALTAGSGGPMVLHQAQAFGSADEATVDFAVLTKALGDCDLANSYLLNGSLIAGLGDESTAVVLEDQSKKQYRTVIVNRTGLVVNVLDVVTEVKRGAAPLDGASKALAKVTDGQCTGAIGECATVVSVKAGPPPVAGDRPGYLAVADVPQPEAGGGTWIGNTPGRPGSLITSGCENLDFGKVEADSSGARTYQLTDKPAGTPDAFGLDEAVFTMSDTTSATELAKQLTDNIESCAKRQLTASVEAGQAISGVGADGVAITGKTYQVTQKVSETMSSHFRLGIAMAGQRVIYTFLPTQDKFDLTDDQWNDLTVRAAARATQAS